MFNLSVALLGPFQAIFNGRPLNNFRTSKVQALFCYLLTENVLSTELHPIHQRETLMDLLWPSYSVKAAQGNLRQTIYNLQLHLNNSSKNINKSHLFLLTNRQTIQINPKIECTLDIEIFYNHIRQTETHLHNDLISCPICEKHLQKAVSLYRGSFLTNIYLPNSYPFEEWVLRRREQLRHKALDAFHLLTAIRLRQGAFKEAQVFALRQLDMDDLRESAYRQLMEALVFDGQSTEALVKYEECRQKLQKDLATQPSFETVELAESIRQKRILSHALIIPERLVPIFQHPPPQHFNPILIGRSTEMKLLHQIWGKASSGNGQMVLISGDPGIGKTRLTDEFLGELGHNVLILHSAATEMNSPLDYSLFTAPLRYALTIKPSPVIKPAWINELCRLLPELSSQHETAPLQHPNVEPVALRQRLFDALCGTLMAFSVSRPLVFMVDNLQWADKTSLDVLTYLSKWVANVPILVIGAYCTSEIEKTYALSLTRVAWERKGRLTNIALSGLPKASMITFFTELVEQENLHRDWGDWLFRETDGNPLFAIKIIEKLKNTGALLKKTASPPINFHIPIPRSIQIVIEERIKHLDEKSQRLLTAVAITRRSFSAEVAKKLSGQNDIDTIDGLENLVLHGLLVEINADRFTFTQNKVREVAYRSLSQCRRKRLHHCMAQILVDHHRGNGDSIIERLTYHRMQAGKINKSQDYPRS